MGSIPQTASATHPIPRPAGGAPHLHRRQFVLGPDPHPAAPGWRSVALPGRLWLSHDPDLAVRRLDDGNGGRAVLLGSAVELDPARAAEPALRPWRTPQELAAQTYAWSGRWCLLAGGWLLGDASGLMGVFHTPAPGGRGMLASGSLALLRTLRPELPAYARRLGWYGANWFPPPGSRVQGIDKLLPDQALDLATGAVARAERWDPDRFAGLCLDDLAERLLASLARTLAVAAGRHGRLWLALTAGLDSRTLLAASMAAGIDVDCVTQMVPRQAVADKLLPPSLAGMAGRRYRLVRPQWPDPARRSAYGAHTAGNCADADNHLWPGGLYDFLRPGEVLLRGGGFEVGRECMDKRLAGLDWAQVRADPARLFQSYGNFGSQRLLGAQAARWVDWAAQGGRAYGLGNQFYRDQRLGGWLSAVEQGLDLLDGTSLQVLNSTYQHDLMLAVPPDQRAEWQVQRRIVEMVCPQMAALPINPRMDPPARLKALARMGWLRRLAGELVNYPADRLRPMPGTPPALRPAPNASPAQAGNPGGTRAIHP